MDLEKVERLLAPFCTKERIKKVCQFGSRVWGSLSNKSDWDFFVVIEDYDGPVHLELDLSLVDCDVDISAYSEEKWNELLAAHDMLILVCDYLPPPFVWKNTCESRSKISLKTLVRGVSKEMSTCLSLSNIHFVKNGDKRTGIKNFVHATRYLAFGTQLATQGRLTNLGASNATLQTALQTLAENPTADYEFFSQIYKPIITQRTKEFQSMIQAMIEREMEPVNADLARGVSPERALLAFLQKRRDSRVALDDLYRTFSVSNSLKSRSDGVSIYLLQSTSDAPERHPISIACGAALVEFKDGEGWRLLGRPLGYITPLSLNNTLFARSIIADPEGSYSAILWPVGSEQIVTWFNSRTDAWNCYCTREGAHSTLIESEFMKTFESMKLKHPVDKKIVATWRFCNHPTSPSLAAIGATSPITDSSKPLDSGNPESEPARTESEDADHEVGFAPLPSLAAFNWPLVDFERFATDEDIRLRVGELEASPFVYAGLYFPHFNGGALVESRSWHARLVLTLPEEQRRESYQYNQYAKHIALAMCCARNDTHEEILDGLNNHAREAVLSELAAYRTMESNLGVLWSLVKSHVEDPAAFAKVIATHKLWRRVAAVLQAVRQHPTRDPMKVLLSSPVTVFTQWKTTFASDEINSVVETVRKSLSTSSSISAATSS